MVYQNFLREFWSTAVAFDLFPSTDEPEKRPLKEFLIKFLVLNGQRPLTLEFNTFCSSTVLDYNNSKYVNHPTPEAVKKELGKIAINSSYLDKTLVLKNLFLVAWRILFTFVIQVLGGNYSSTKQVNSIQQLFAYSPITRTEVDIGEIIYSDLITKLLNKSRLKYMIVVNNQRDSVSPLPLAAKPKKGKSQTVTPTLPKSQGLEGSEKSHSVSSGTVPNPQDLQRDIQLASTGLPSTLDDGTHKSQPLPEGKATPPKDSGGNIQPLDRDLTSTTSDEGTTKTTPRTGAKYQVDQTQFTRLRYQSLPENKSKTSSEDELDRESDEKEVLAAMEDMDDDTKVAEEVRTPSPKQDQPEPSHKISRVLFSRITKTQWEQHEEATVSYADLNAFIKEYYDENLLKDISHAIKNDPATNKKIDEAIETFAKISTNTTEILFVVKGFNFSTLQSSLKDLHAHALKQETDAAAWAKSYTNMAWNLGSRMTSVDLSQTALKRGVSSLKQYTSKIKSMMTKIYQAFKVPPTQAITSITPHPESSHAALRIDKRKGIATELDEDPSKKLVPASSIVRPDPDEPDKEEQIKKAEKQVRLFELTRPEVIKVVQEEAEKIGLDP
ncbi:hypothetical protein Tco_0132256 [Tanacetum coccineum]